jgi:hypothetical protein
MGEVRAGAPCEVNEVTSYGGAVEMANVCCPRPLAPVSCVPEYTIIELVELMKAAPCLTRFCVIAVVGDMVSHVLALRLYRCRPE